jgi:hypothetical protein
VTVDAPDRSVSRNGLLRKGDKIDDGSDGRNSLLYARPQGDFWNFMRHFNLSSALTTQGVVK